MLDKNIFVKKKILIYGLGKSGLSSYFFLKKKNKIWLFDDFKVKDLKTNRNIVNIKKIINEKFDFILISPGININKCLLTDYLQKNLNKIVTDLDIFYINYTENINIAITGTNGKSTTAKIIYKILKYHKKDARLTGNIGNPILNEKKINKNTIFVIEVSSYQIEYSQYFKANYAMILNISPDHLERHGTLKKYVKAKFKLIKNQNQKDCCFLDIKNNNIKNEIQRNKIKAEIINVNKNIINKLLPKIKNPYFFTDGNKQNLMFIIALVKKINLKITIFLKVINNFKSLKFRQEIIHNSKKLTIINDSKATSFSSSMSVLKNLNKVHWIIGGIPKKGDEFTFSRKKCLNFKAYIFGKNKNFFINKLKNKIKYQTFIDLESTLNKIKLDLVTKKNEEHEIILFSPASASFDNYVNFEDRGNKFNSLIKKLKIINEKY